jgi:hypothetical protein
MQSPKTLAGTFPSGSLCRVRCSVFCLVSSRRRFFVDEEAMSITPIILVLVILLFGFDSAGQAKTRQRHKYG